MRRASWKDKALVQDHHRTLSLPNICQVCSVNETVDITRDEPPGVGAGRPARINSRLASRRPSYPRLALATFAASLGGSLAILGEVALVMLGTTVALFAALASGLGCARGIIREIAAALLPASVAGARRLFAILGEVARVAGVSLVSHVEASSLPFMVVCDGIADPVTDSTECADMGCLHDSDAQTAIRVMLRNAIPEMY
jgi:hypothetical protein